MSRVTVYPDYVQIYINKVSTNIVPPVVKDENVVEDHRDFRTQSDFNVLEGNPLRALFVVVCEHKVIIKNIDRVDERVDDSLLVDQGKRLWQTLSLPAAALKRAVVRTESGKHEDIRRRLEAKLASAILKFRVA